MLNEEMRDYLDGSNHFNRYVGKWRVSEKRIKQIIHEIENDGSGEHFLNGFKAAYAYYKRMGGEFGE